MTGGRNGERRRVLGGWEELLLLLWDLLQWDLVGHLRGLDVGAGQLRHGGGSREGGFLQHWTSLMTMTAGQDKDGVGETEVGSLS